MHKALLTHPHIGSYSAFLFFGIFGGYLLSRWLAVRAGVKPSNIDNLALLIAIFSLFGARFFSWLFYFPPGVSLFKALLDTRGGMVFYGGMIFGALTVVIYCRIARLELSNLMDVFAPGLALGLALGRVGCFLAGCCWGDLCVDSASIANAGLGKLSDRELAWQVRTIPALSQAGFPLAVRFPQNTGAYEQHQELGFIDKQAAESLPVHPVQLYEAVLALILCVMLGRWFSRRRWQGQVVCLFIYGYALIRFGTEFFRADNQPSYFGLTLSQVISLMLAALATIAWAGRKAEGPMTVSGGMATAPSQVPPAP